MGWEKNHAPMRNGERGSWRPLLGPILLIGLAFLIWQNRSLARELADLKSSLKEVDSRLESNAESLSAVSALRPSLIINPRLADEIAERVLARMSVPANAAPGIAGPASAAEPERPTDVEVRNAASLASEEKANSVVDAAIRAGKWRQEDVLSVRGLLAKAGDPDASRRVGMRIASAINRDEIQPESPEFMLP